MMLVADADMNHESAYGDFMGMIGLVSYLTAFTLIKRPLLSSGVTFAVRKLFAYPCLLHLKIRN